MKWTIARLGTLVGILSSPGARADEASLTGVWSSPRGRLDVAQQSDRVVGEGIAKCNPAANGHLLEADVLEDSLSGQIYVCLQGCDKGPAWVPVLLLIGADGKSMAGTSTLPKGCKAALGPNGSLILKRQTQLAGELAIQAPAPQPSKPPRSPKQPERTAALEPLPKEPPKEPGPPVAREPREPKEPSRESPVARAKAIELARDGAAFQNEGKFEQARRRFQQAIEIDPYYAEGYNGIGVTFFARNDLTEALRWYKRALGADPSFGDAYYNMACVYALQNRKSLALRYLRTAFHKGFTSREVMRDDPDLAALHGDSIYEALLGETP